MGRQRTNQSSWVCLPVCLFFLITIDAANVTVSNGYELHAALSSPNIDEIYLIANVSLTPDTCPFPSHDMFQATIITRNLLIASYPGQQQQQQQPESNAAAAESTFYWLNCHYLSDRFTITSGHTLTLRNLVMQNCETYSPIGIFRKAEGSTIRMENVIAFQGSVCLAPDVAYNQISSRPRSLKFPLHIPDSSSSSSVNSSSLGQQLMEVSTKYNSTNWCSAVLQLSSSASSRSSSSRAGLPAAANTGLCQHTALLVADLAIEDRALNTTSGEPPQQYTLRAVNTTWVCPDPVSSDCLIANGAEACLAAAYAAVNPDNDVACPATDGFSFHQCIVNPRYAKIMLLSDVVMNLTTCPSSEVPAQITRNVTILSDPRGPRLTWDCGSLSDRLWLMPGYSLTLNHVILANCSTPKPVSIMRFSVGSELFINDTIVLPAPGLCLPADQQLGGMLHQPRPANLSGVQSMQPGKAGSWCAMGWQPVGREIANPRTGTVSKVPTSITPQDNSRQSPIARLTSFDVYDLFANTTGFGPGYAATLSNPAAVSYYVHPTWPASDLCSEPAMILNDVAVMNDHGWVEAEDAAAANSADAGSGAYNGSFLLHYRDAASICLSPLSLAGCSDPGRPENCLLAAYDRVNPDLMLLPGAAAYRRQQQAEAAKRNHVNKVILPGVLGSVVPVLLLAVILGVVYRRRRHREALHAAALVPQSKGKQIGASYNPYHSGPGPSSISSSGGPLSPQSINSSSSGFVRWLKGGGAGGGKWSSRYGSSSTFSSNDPERRLLDKNAASAATPSTADRSSVAGGVITTSTSSGGLFGRSSPDGISLNVLLGAGSFGRVYAGTWQGSPVAVKIITHSSADDRRIRQELALSLSFDHPNLVRALHYAKMTINPSNAAESLGAPSTLGSNDVFLPEGAVGVFTLPSTWAIIQRGTATQPAPTLDTETWIVMDLMDCGNLAAAVRHNKLFEEPDTGHINMGRILRRAADVAAGVSYLHSRNVCHGDLKCENCLLKSEPQDPDGLLAKVADFGLSRALALGQSHLSTRRYGTVTHMPPELLVAGKLTPAADVYSFGIMMWEFVTRKLPFAGLHHGEVIHRVVTQDLRPGPWPEQPEQLGLHPSYIPLAEACWSRQAADRPSMPAVLQGLLEMLAEVEGLGFDPVTSGTTVIDEGEEVNATIEEGTEEGDNIV